MKQHRLISSDFANNITADSASPRFLQKTFKDADSKTWREIAAVHGAVNYGQMIAFRPLIKLKPQNGFVNRSGDDDLTIEEAIKKGIIPKGMRATWSPEA